MNFPSLSVVPVEKGPGVGFSFVDIGLNAIVKSATGAPSKVTLPVTGASLNPSPWHPATGNAINAQHSKRIEIVSLEICLLTNFIRFEVSAL